MKLFIWAEPYQIDYGSAMLIAVAETEDEARAIAEGAPRYSYGQYRNRNETGGGVKLGEPTRVVDLPCAEWHEWQE
jgi:hypothetical protein